MGEDTAKIRAAFIERQLVRAQELAREARQDSGAAGRAAREDAAHIVNEFRRYCEWCHDVLPEADRSRFDLTLQNVELTIARKFLHVLDR